MNGLLLVLSSFGTSVQATFATIAGGSDSLNLEQLKALLKQVTRARNTVMSVVQAHKY